MIVTPRSRILATIPLDHPLRDLGRIGGHPRPRQEVANGVGQRAAEQLPLVGLGPGAAEPGHHLGLDLEPERLGVDEQPVHVEQDGLRPSGTVPPARVP